MKNYNFYTPFMQKCHITVCSSTCIFVAEQHPFSAWFLAPVSPDVHSAFLEPSSNSEILFIYNPGVQHL